MKRTLTIISLVVSLHAGAQLFNGPAGAILNNGVDTYFDLPVSGLSPAQLDSTFGIEQVCIDIVHPAVEELNIYLQSPAGEIVALTEGSDCQGANYTNTCFNNMAGTGISNMSSPYTGNFKPTGYLGRFNTSQAGNGTWRLIIHDGVPFVNAGNLISWSIQFGNNPAHPVMFTSSNLPIVIINTGNQDITDVKKLISMGIIYNGVGARNSIYDARNNFNGKCTIHFRGHTSRNFEKKPYSIETTDAIGNTLSVSLLGMPSESDWDLIAMYQDKSLIRIPLTYDLARRMGHYSSRYKMVELVINNEYQGVYAFTEKIKQDQNRVNISKLTSNDNSSPAVTGGYILKIDRTDAPGWYSLLPGGSTGSAHFYYNYVYPNDTNITTQQRTYLKSTMDNFETIMNSPSFNNPTTGYASCIDAGSFIDFFIINELSKNIDAYRLSTYMYKDNIAQGGKLHIGPVWDYDLAWHNCNYGNSFNSFGWQYEVPDTAHPIPNWWLRFISDTTFMNNLYCRWTTLRQGILSIGNLNAYIDSSASVLYESQQRNFTQWPILGTYIFPNPQNQVGANYQSEVADLKNWIANRIAWMDGLLNGQCQNMGIKENTFISKFSVYPNPFESATTFELHLSESADVSIKIIDVTGKEIALLINERRHPGEFKIIFDRKETPAGIYFYEVKINNSMKTGKIIIQ